jgi:hypothetical protein
VDIVQGGQRLDALRQPPACSMLAIGCMFTKLIIRQLTRPLAKKAGMPALA